MITKEKLLELGVPEHKVDSALEQLSKAEIDNNDSSIEQLKGILNKATDSTNENEYDEDYMTQYFDRFVSDNKNLVKAQFEEMGLIKAQTDDELDAFSDDNQADATLIDGTDLMKASVKGTQKLFDAFNSMEERMKVMEKAVAYSTAIIEKMASVAVDNSDSLEKALRQPLPAKGQNTYSFNQSPTSDKVMMKAKELGYDGVMNLLNKAVTDGVDGADYAVTELELAGGNLIKAPAAQKMITKLAQIGG